MPHLEAARDASEQVTRSLHARCPHVLSGHFMAFPSVAGSWQTSHGAEQGGSCVGGGQVECNFGCGCGRSGRGLGRGLGLGLDLDRTSQKQSAIIKTPRPQTRPRARMSTSAAEAEDTPCLLSFHTFRLLTPDQPHLSSPQPSSPLHLLTHFTHLLSTSLPDSSTANSRRASSGPALPESLPPGTQNIIVTHSERMRIIGRSISGH
ncbi:unnamed protein product [Diplocarpon coronariae]|nr:hypothetical protein JHW43_002349 [Diplocarpon mali]